MKHSIKLIAGILIISSVFAIHSEDEVNNLPDYPYTGRLHSGFLSLQNPKKKLHYILVESDSNPATDPVLLWLNGGPGCSSLNGFSQEMGPALFEPGTATWKVNPNRWNKNANVIYLESPAGVGFSYNDDKDDVKYNDVKSGKENLEAVVDFFRKFPSLVNNEFYISGESYAGIYIPYLASNIIDYNATAAVRINLKGLLIGNGVTDWTVDAEAAMPDFAFQHALYPIELREEYIKYCFHSKVQAKCDEVTDKIFELIDKVNIYGIYEQCFVPNELALLMSKNKNGKYKHTPFLSLNRRNKPLDFLTSPSGSNGPPCADEIGFHTYYNRQDVRKALHVRLDAPYFEICSDEVGDNYDIDREKGSFYLYPKLIQNKLRIFKFSGDTDACVPYNGTEKWIKKLNLKILKEYSAWDFGDKFNIGGYSQKYDGITLVTVRGAGHMVPQTRPLAAFYLLSQFLKGEDL